MDIHQCARSYPLQDVMDFKDVFSMFWTSSIILLYKIFIRSLYVVNFNVSSTEDNAHAKLSRYV